MLHLEKKDLVASTIRFRVVMLVFDHHHPDGLVLVHGCSIVANRVCTIDRDWGRTVVQKSGVVVGVCFLF